MVIINSINQLYVKMNRLSSQDVTFNNTPSRTLMRTLRRPWRHILPRQQVSIKLAFVIYKALW